jgi:hypothetical protein
MDISSTVLLICIKCIEMFLQMFFVMEFVQDCKNDCSQ